MTAKTVTFTLKMNKDIRDVMKEFCNARGFMMKGFVEKAIMDEIEKEELKEDLGAIHNYEKYERETTIPLEKVADNLCIRYGRKTKRHV
jgi:hypothetical protein